MENKIVKNPNLETSQIIKNFRISEHETGSEPEEILSPIPKACCSILQEQNRDLRQENVELRREIDEVKKNFKILEFDYENIESENLKYYSLEIDAKRKDKEFEELKDWKNKLSDEIDDQYSKIAQLKKLNENLTVTNKTWKSLYFSMPPKEGKKQSLLISNLKRLNDEYSKFKKNIKKRKLEK